MHDKLVAILGFGTEGEASAEYAINAGAQVTICDALSPEALGERYKKWQERGVAWQLGEDYLVDLTRFDIIFRSPGISPLHKELIKAQKKGVQITSQTREFFSHTPCKVIGVTGTKGKGTTASLIHQMLLAANRDAVLVGNIGVPALTVLSHLDQDSWVVYELSSFQLQDATHSPQIAVLLAITPDHLDYHASMDEYVQAKLNIVRYQTQSDVAVCGYEVVENVAKLTTGSIVPTRVDGQIENGVYAVDNAVYCTVDGAKERVIDIDDIALRGKFNLANIVAAVAAAQSAGVSIESMRQVLRTFTGLPHRLQYVRTVDDVAYWDNSYATGPDATIAAIQSFKEPCVLMLGGSDKGLSYEQMAQAIVRSHVKCIVGIGANSRAMYDAISLYRERAGLGLPNYVDGGDTMKEMVEVARRAARPGDVVLLSPAAASFDKFANASDRGDQFIRAVSNL